ncbi:hypothetical protein FBQ87_17195, partial [Sphingobacteriales bacterium CHB3]|nr:hypothetical protein [Sphingobacteriales bacterium CHB3]
MSPEQLDDRDVANPVATAAGQQRSSNNGDNHSGRLNKAELKKRFRLGEFLAEKLVTSIAMVSLAAIVLIFLFVFREAAPIFMQKERPVHTVEVEEEETYGEEFLGE